MTLPYLLDFALAKIWGIAVLVTVILSIKKCVVGCAQDGGQDGAAARVTADGPGGAAAIQRRGTGAAGSKRQVGFKCTTAAMLISRLSRQP